MHSFKKILCHAQEFNQVCFFFTEQSLVDSQWTSLSGLVRVVGDPYDQTICLQKQQISELCKNPNNFKIIFIFDTKIKMLTPLAQFPTITFKIATDSVSKIVFHF